MTKLKFTRRPVHRSLNSYVWLRYGDAENISRRVSCHAFYPSPDSRIHLLCSALIVSRVNSNHNGDESRQVILKVRGLYIWTNSIYILLEC
jgi:hypothetical protein